MVVPGGDDGRRLHICKVDASKTLHQQVTLGINSSEPEVINC